MQLGTRAILQSVARRALSALLAGVCLLLPVAALAARQAAGWTGAGTCGMACCKRSGHCCCRKPKPAPSGPVLTTPGCPAGCAAPLQPGQSGAGLFLPAERPSADYPTAPKLLAKREPGSRKSAWRLASLRQRPPPGLLSFRFEI